MMPVSYHRPCRASLLTGLMPSQHGVHRYLAAQGAQMGPRACNTIQEFATLPKLLCEPGYSTSFWTRRAVSFIEQHRRDPSYPANSDPASTAITTLFKLLSRSISICYRM
jgi:arylsulfatase A-like enzyme